MSTPGQRVRAEYERARAVATEVIRDRYPTARITDDGDGVCAIIDDRMLRIGLPRRVDLYIRGPAGWGEPVTEEALQAADIEMVSWGRAANVRMRLAIYSMRHPEWAAKGYS